MAMPELSAIPAWWWWTAATLLGLCTGSFLNVVVHRLPRGESVLWPRSRCPRCSRAIRPWENVPLLGWIFLRGRCAGCGGAISPRYPIVELATGALAALCLWRFGPTPEALVTFALLAAMLAVALIDSEHMIIPDAISLGFLVLGLALAPFTGPGIVGALLGVLAGGGLLLAVGWAWEKARGVEAMGGGDIKLMAAVGAFLGATGALLVIFLGAAIGAVVGSIILRRQGQARIAFGSFLAAATLVVALFGPQLVDWYVGLLRPSAG